MKRPTISHSDPAVASDCEKLVLFVDLFCEARHPGAGKAPYRLFAPRAGLSVESSEALCPECARLLGHALVKRVSCPLDPKPKCRKCPKNCYLPAYREAMQEVMRFSGPRSLLARWED